MKRIRVGGGTWGAMCMGSCLSPGALGHASVLVHWVVLAAWPTSPASYVARHHSKKKPSSLGGGNNRGASFGPCTSTRESEGVPLPPRGTPVHPSCRYPPLLPACQIRPSCYLLPSCAHPDLRRSQERPASHPPPSPPLLSPHHLPSTRSRADQRDVPYLPLPPPSHSAAPSSSPTHSRHHVLPIPPPFSPCTNPPPPSPLRAVPA